MEKHELIGTIFIVAALICLVILGLYCMFKYSGWPIEGEIAVILAIIGVTGIIIYNKDN